MGPKAGHKRTLVSFDLSQYESEQVIDAKLRFYVTYNGGIWGKGQERTIEVHKLLKNWSRIIRLHWQTI